MQTMKKLNSILENSEVNLSPVVPSGLICILFLIIFCFFVCGWKIGLVAIGAILLIDFFIYIYEKYKFRRVLSEMERLVVSGLRPYLMYTNSDELGIKYKIELDNRFSILYAEIKSDFKPVVVFLSDKNAEAIKKENFDSRSKLKEVYTGIVSDNMVFFPNIRTLSVLKECLLYRKIQ